MVILVIIGYIISKYGDFINKHGGRDLGYDMMSWET